MKGHLLIPALALLASTLRAAEPAPPAVDGFLEIPFGTNEDATKKGYVARTHARFDRQKSNETQLRFEGGRFAGFKVTHADLKFAAGGFFCAEVFLEATSKDHEKEFATIKQMLTEKYGAPGRDERVGENLETDWHFPIPGQPANLIWIISLPHGEGVKVIYQSDATRKAAPKPAMAGQAKPARTSASAKDDL